MGTGGRSGFFDIGDTPSTNAFWEGMHRVHPGDGGLRKPPQDPPGENAHSKARIEALPLSGPSISGCFTGIAIIQPHNFPEEHSSLATSAGEERGEGSRRQEGAAGRKEGFSDSHSAACQASQNGW